MDTHVHRKQNKSSEFQKIENCSKCVVQSSSLHDKLHVTEKFFFEYVVLL